MTRDYSDRPRLSSVLGAAKVEVGEEDGTKVVFFYVINDAQQGWIREKLLSEFETKMRRLLGTAAVRIEILVTPDEQVAKKVYTPQEQAEALMKDNPEVKNLVSDMGLDV